MVAREPVWIRTESILAVHQAQIAEHGGMPGVRDASLLEATIARPQQLFAYGQPKPGLPALAAAYGYGIIRNHPFIDGNKRTGLIALGIFLAFNGAELLAQPTDMFTIILACASGEFTEEQLVSWIASHSR